MPRRLLSSSASPGTHALALSLSLSVVSCSGAILGPGADGEGNAGGGGENGAGATGATSSASGASGVGAGAEGAGANSSSAGGGAAGGGAQGAGASSTGGAMEVDPGDSPDGVPLSTRFARLTHRQYDNTVADLLGVSVSLSAAFLDDPVFAGYDNSAEGLAVAGRLGRDYRRAAEELAAAVTADPQLYARLVVCEPAQADCDRQFISDFGSRAFRRPLTAAEEDKYLGLHARGAELVASGDAFRDGVQLTVEAFLQSPNFLYRVESSDVATAEGFIPLNGYEIASRLSFMLWNTMPDETLFEAASSGTLDTATGIAEQAARMLDDPRARGVVTDFHDQWLDLDHYRDLTKSAALYPEFQSDLSDALQEETRRFIAHVVFDLDGGLESLLRAPYTFVNEALAPLYGLSGITGQEFVKVDLDSSRRGGFLTQIGFLASHAYPTNTSPIHRGVFVLRRILCFPLPDPPGDVDLNLPPIQGEIRTTRQQVTVHTSPNACSNCHGVINPIGFGFEQFDSIGRYRTTENGESIDTTGTVPLDGEQVSFSNASGLLDAIANSDDARRCYAKNWLTYAYGREHRESDTRTLDDLTIAVRDPGYSVKSLLSYLTQTKAFRHRVPNTVYQP